MPPEFDPKRNYHQYENRDDEIIMQQQYQQQQHQNTQQYVNHHQSNTQQTNQAPQANHPQQIHHESKMTKRQEDTNSQNANPINSPTIIINLEEPIFPEHVELPEAQIVTPQIMHSPKKQSPTKSPKSPQHRPQDVSNSPQKKQSNIRSPPVNEPLPSPKSPKPILHTSPTQKKDLEQSKQYEVMQSMNELNLDDAITAAKDIAEEAKHAKETAGDAKAKKRDSEAVTTTKTTPVVEAAPPVVTKSWANILRTSDPSAPPSKEKATKNSTRKNSHPAATVRTLAGKVMPSPIYLFDLLNRRYLGHFRAYVQK
jgi:hypothetical protein